MDTKQIILGSLRVTGYKTDYILNTIESSGDFYEGALLRKWTPFFQDAQYILDIGANLGNHTMFWATNLSAKRIISFEPFPANYAVLTQNINNNSLFSVQAIQMAVSDHSGNLAVKEFTDKNYGATTFEHVDTSEQDANVIQSRSIDSVFYQLNLPRIDFVKIDTEGFELSVLRGMMSVIQKFHPVFWVEASEDTAAEVYRVLCDNGYRLVDVSGANTLFISEHIPVSSCISMSQLLEQSILHVSRANKYYANYQTAKEWLNGKNLSLEQANKKIAHLNEALEKFSSQNCELMHNVDVLTQNLKNTTRNYEDCKNCLEKRDLAYASLQEENCSLEEKLKQNQKLLSDSEKFLADEEHFLKTLQTEVHAMKWKSARYDALHNRLSKSWYGRIMLTCYRKLRKIKAAFSK